MSKFISKRQLPKASSGNDFEIPVDEEDHDESGHARVDDPVLPPARMLHVAFSTNTSGEEPNNRSKGDSILSRLFDPDRKQKPALWTVRYSGKTMTISCVNGLTQKSRSILNSLLQDRILPRGCYVGGEPDI
jgi:hypothetical protein